MNKFEELIVSQISN